ncbi:unnamed protein product [Darwinula stevensoni]|uniref:GIY-YIG domain-containing protein n=1 Tax=Darwinula stevensoni TaxID=69355 RepID=A0A7R8XDC2_9CRUS|nr:unnamed protein product [Darwinula stevensoni]CAG0886657.1 unnamed protein product [Darwinula stevensoni]
MRCSEKRTKDMDIDRSALALGSKEKIMKLNFEIRASVQEIQNEFKKIHPDENIPDEKTIHGVMEAFRRSRGQTVAQPSCSEKNSFYVLVAKTEHEDYLKEERKEFCKWITLKLEEDRKFLDRAFFTNYADFYLNGKVKRENVQFSGLMDTYNESQDGENQNDNIQDVQSQKDDSSERVTVWCALSRKFFIGPFFIETEMGASFFNNSEENESKYQEMLQDRFSKALEALLRKEKIKKCRGWSKPCKGCNCTICPNMRECNSLDMVGENGDMNTHQVVAVEDVNCKSDNVIYCITCLKCNQQYIGMTVCLRNRITQHKREIAPQTSTKRDMKEVEENGRNPKRFKRKHSVREAETILMADEETLMDDEMTIEAAEEGDETREPSTSKGPKESIEKTKVVKGLPRHMENCVPEASKRWETKTEHKDYLKEERKKFCKWITSKLEEDRKFLDRAFFTNYADFYLNGNVKREDVQFKGLMDTYNESQDGENQNGNIQDVQSQKDDSSERVTVWYALSRKFFIGPFFIETEMGASFFNNSEKNESKYQEMLKDRFSKALEALLRKEKIKKCRGWSKPCTVTGRKCVLCPNMRECNSLNMVGENGELKTHQVVAVEDVNCKSENVIYCITCLKCNQQYIGMTGFLRDRIAQHKREIDPQPSTKRDMKEVEECRRTPKRFKRKDSVREVETISMEDEETLTDDEMTIEAAEEGHETREPSTSIGPKESIKKTKVVKGLPAHMKNCVPEASKRWENLDVVILHATGCTEVENLDMMETYYIQKDHA